MVYSKEVGKRYREKNREKINSKRRERYKKDAWKEKIYNEKNKERSKIVNKTHRAKPETKEKRRIYGIKYREKNKEKIKERDLEYVNRPENKKRILNYQNEYCKKRRKEDEQFNIKYRLRNHVYGGLKKYTETGKIMKSKKYGIDIKAIAEHLGPCPGNINLYEIDHILPLCSFDLTDKREIQKAFTPKNHRWLLTKKNRKKGGSSDRKMSIHKKK